MPFSIYPGIRFPTVYYLFRKLFTLESWCWLGVVMTTLISSSFYVTQLSNTSSTPTSPPNPLSISLIYYHHHHNHNHYLNHHQKPSATAMSSTLRAASDAIPTRIKPPLLIFLNIVLSTAFSYFASPWIGEDVTAIQRPMTTLSDYMGLVGWRIIEVMCHWYGGWDATQAASLVMLSLAPSMHYMHTFQPTHSPLFPTLAAVAAGDLLSLYLPLMFLRQSPPDSRSTPAKKENKVFDSTRVVTTLLTSIIYQLVLFSSSKKFLVSWLLTSGWDLESVERVYGAPEGMLLARAAMMIPVGWAASEIIFYSPNDASDSAITTHPAAEKKEGPAEGETGIWAYLFRLWIKSLSPRSRKVVKRTLLVATYQGVSATVALAGTVKGGDFRGAVGVSSVWTVATIIVGGVLGWVGKV